MFLGTYEHSLDDKGRLVLPSTFRAPLAGGAFVTKGLDGCLAVWTPEEFQQEAAEMVERAKRGGEAERMAARSYAAGAASVTPDRTGRIAIPQSLRRFAGLDREVVVTGNFNRIELWDAARWDAVDRMGEAHLANPEQAAG